MTLEICAYNIDSCRIAVAAAASRIELCASPAEGGVTPSWGTISYALEHISIPIFPMIRPRGGNFVYNDDELAIMHRDILKCKELGCKGIATGVQLPNGKIDTVKLKKLVALAGDMEVTCHKVFDNTPEAYEALEAVISAGCKRILTSGLRKTATEGADLLRNLVKESGNRIIIMPGGGVRSTNIQSLITQTGALAYHSSCIVPNNLSNTADMTEMKAIIHAMKEK